MDRILVDTTTKADRLLVAGLVDLQPVFDALQGSVLIVGGLMTRLWLHAQPIGLPARATADVDLGIDRRRLLLGATSRVIRPLLEKHGFDSGGGAAGEPFRFSKEFTGGQKLVVDLLVAPGASRSEPPLLEKGLTSLAAPGLAYALLRGAYVMPVDFLDDGEISGFDLPPPHLDAAFVMKAELTRSGMRSRADRRRTDTVDAMSLAASCLDRPDSMEALKTHRTRSDVRGALRWIGESFGDPKMAAARRVEEHFRQGCRFSVSRDHLILTNMGPLHVPRPEPRAGVAMLTGASSRTLLPLWFLAPPVRLAFDDELIGRALEPVDRTLGEQRIRHGREPFIR